MKIIISPAKKMNVDTDIFSYKEVPCFVNKTEELKTWIQSLSFAEAQKMWACNDKIAEQNFKRFQEMDLKRNLTPALISYEGIQYQYMAPRVFAQSEWDYVQEHLRILSGFYGVVKPLDGVVPYRLEMQAKVDRSNGLEIKDLYDFWSRLLYDEVMDEDRRILNLASKEYSKCIEKYLESEDVFLTCIFGEEKNGKVVQKGTQAKMARGEMVRFMAEKKVKDFEELKAFDRLGYKFDPERSSEKEFVFIKQ
jgi:cytoplasmic iron level regulating protein YaaA (DUF328/UPF0246 family)